MNPEKERYSIRTDLALEALAGRPIPGVHMEEAMENDVAITRVHVQTPAAGRELGKSPGRYITLDAPGLRDRTREMKETMARIIGRELQALLGLPLQGHVFVVGLGNRQATPDALGPRVIEHLLVTRHLWDHVAPDLRGGLRQVSALAPGVLGVTGIETWDVIAGIVDRTRPAAVIAVDALAARSIDRILTSVQLADSGISPGSGVGNRRAGLSRETLGVPVIAIGVPTVVHAVTIASDAIDILVHRLSAHEALYQLLGAMSPGEKHQLIDEILSPEVGDLMVTPKEIDLFIEDMGQVLAAGINKGLHPEIDSFDLAEALTMG